MELVIMFICPLLYREDESYTINIEHFVEGELPK